jgi:serine/threonine protein kinase
MSEDGSNKTRLKPAVSKSTEADDSTRIKTADKKPGAEAKADKTRVAASTSETVAKATSADRPGSTNDQTRVAIRSNNKEADSIEATRFKSDTPAAVDKTRIAPSRRTREIPDDANLESSGAKIGEHGILKKRFVLETVLGLGGMGVVYKARDLLKVEAQDRDPYVAIKVLSEEFKSHPEAFISLQRESRKSQRIAHPNIVNVFDFDRDGETVFMTMEFLDGTSLDELIRQYQSTGLPTDDVWEITFGMSSALSYAHAEHIIHSDFKPGNVFVTAKNVTKVFDFGIARAVAQVEQVEGSTGDLTVFDAGNLGALTPAYASLEMLEGEEPDVRDDIFALGCVVYEMFTGEHPYNKVPADEAERQGLQPKRINNIKKYQWRTIEKAIAFRRENRVESVDQFVEEISPRVRVPYRVATVLALLLSVVIGGYFFFQKANEPSYSEFDIRNELELKIRIDFYKESLTALIAGPTFTDPWQESVWKDMSALTALTKGVDSWVAENEVIIYNLYLAEIKVAVAGNFYSKARQLIENAKRYTQDFDELKLQSVAIAKARDLNKADEARQAALAKARQQELLEKQRKQAIQNQQQTEQATKQKEQKQLFDVALENVNNQLQCQGRLNMRNIETATLKLKELDRARYDELQTKIINSLAACIIQIGKAFPERALEAKKHGQRIFTSSQVLAAITIQSRDPCDQSLAGLGAKGKRAVCKDKTRDAGTGPELVVIPGNSKIKAFAIGKYELSVGELNVFCKKSTICETITNRDAELPASEIKFDVAKAYLKWLSRQSDQKYRLPSKIEWLHAAKSRQKFLDPNRNCELSTRGIVKGGELVKHSIGMQNSWGLVNYVGNVQEWVYEPGRKLVAVGGSYRNAMENCDIITTNTHDGSADKSTGLRVLRELRSDA